MVEVIETQLTLAQFLAMAEASDARMEYTDGEIYVMGTPTPEHQTLVLAIAILLTNLKSGGQVFVAPLEVALDENNVVQPDVMYVAAKSRCKIGEERLHGAPELVVEVFSSSTALRDKREKFRLYEKHGVWEYWMVDPVSRYMEMWRMGNTRFILQGVYGPGETFESAVFAGQSVSAQALFEA